MKIIFKILKAGSGTDVYFKTLSDELKKHNIETEIISKSNYLEHFPWLLKLLNSKTNADIIHSVAEYGWAFKEANKPLIVTLHNSVFNELYFKSLPLYKQIYYTIFLKPNIKKYLKCADIILTGSNSTKKDIIQGFGNLNIENKIKMIYYGIDFDKFKKEGVKLDNSKFKLLFVGNLIHRKGVDLLPNIMKDLGKAYELYYVPGLRKVRIKGLGNNIKSIKEVGLKNVLEAYNYCDALLFPTRLEGFGYVLLEALACGKPVISTNCSSIPEIVEEGKTGYLCKFEDITDFRNKICELREKYEGFNKRMANERAMLLDKFSLQRMAKEYKIVYLELIK